MLHTRIYGAEDNTIVVDGLISAEIAYSTKSPALIRTSDGTEARIRYDNAAAKWVIELTEQGSQCGGVLPAVEPDSAHTGFAEGCTPESDVLLLNDLAWVSIGRHKLHAR